ncbi:hypothetical protein SNE40_021886 [Patella caerulea]
MVKYLKYIAGLFIIYLTVYSNIFSIYLQTRLISNSSNFKPVRTFEDSSHHVDASGGNYKSVSNRNNSLDKVSIFKSNAYVAYASNRPTDAPTANYKHVPRGNSSSEEFNSFKSIRNLQHGRGHSTSAPTTNYIQVRGENSSVDKFSSCSRNASLIALDKRKNPVFDGEYLLNNKSICCGPTPIIAIVVVHTAPHHFNRRQNVRETYGSRELFLPIEIRVIFLLGRVNSSEMQNKILRENTRYGDIIQGNFIDAYHNLTLKAVMGLHWISHYCSKVKYVIKTDDDVMFDMWKFLELVDAKNLYVSNTIYCICRNRDIIYRDGKWAVDNVYFKGQTRYPFKYCMGFVIVFSGDVIPTLYSASYVVPFLWIDDVYVTGMLRTAVNGIKIIPQGGDLKITDFKFGATYLKYVRHQYTYLAFVANENTFRDTWNFIKEWNQK